MSMAPPILSAIPVETVDTTVISGDNLGDCTTGVKGYASKETSHQEEEEEVSAGTTEEEEEGDDLDSMDQGTSTYPMDLDAEVGEDDELLLDNCQNTAQAAILPPASVLEGVTSAAVAPTQEETRPASYVDQSHFEMFNMLDQPVWIFDIVKRCMWWANSAAVELWSAESLEDLLARNFAEDMSDATKNRLDDYLLKFSQNSKVKVTEQWTFYPNGEGPKTVDCTFQGVEVEEGRLATLIQGIYKPLSTKAEEEALRAVEMVRHLPVAVSLTDMAGNVLEQNPEALAVFGNCTETNDADTASSASSGDEGDEIDNSSQKRRRHRESTPATSSAKKPDTTFIKRFADPELGHKILKDATDRPGEVISLEAIQQTVHGPKLSSISVRQTKDPVTSQPILLYSARDISHHVQEEKAAKKQQLENHHAENKESVQEHVANAVRAPLQHLMGVIELLNRAATTISSTDTTKPAAVKCMPADPFSDRDRGQSREEERSVSQLLESSVRLLMTVLQDFMDSVGIKGGGFCIADGIVSEANRSTGSGMKQLSRHYSKRAKRKPPRNRTRRRSNAISITTSNNNNRKNSDATGSFERQNSATTDPSRSAAATGGTGGGVIDVKDVLKCVLKDIKPQAEAKQLNMTAKLRSNEASCKCVGDTKTLTGILAFLLQKAVRSTPPQGDVDILVRRIRRSNDSRRVRYNIDVSDTGSGLNLEQQQIFSNLLTTVNATDIEGSELVLCKSMVEEMGGTISVESKPGLGSHFSVEIPFLLAGANTTRRSFLRQSSHSSLSLGSLKTIKDEGGMQILLVDEDNRGRKVMRALLEQYGHTISTASSGDEMVRVILENQCYDLILLETQLTDSAEIGVSSLEATRVIRENGYSAERLPILAFTSAAAPPNIFALGLNDWLVKPMPIKIIQAAMTNAICNVGTAASSVGLMSIFNSSDPTLDPSVDYDRTASRRSRRRSMLSTQDSFGSVDSSFSKHLQAVSKPQISNKSCENSETLEFVRSALNSHFPAPPSGPF